MASNLQDGLVSWSDLLFDEKYLMYADYYPRKHALNTLKTSKSSPKTV